jgi:hypothetical protein
MDKVTELAFPEHSKFLDACLDTIRSKRSDLIAGRPIIIKLPAGGYNRMSLVAIDPRETKYFWIDKKTDPTRFSARIRAGALALHRIGIYGEFDMSHLNGVLAIRRIAPHDPSASSATP